MSDKLVGCLPENVDPSTGGPTEIPSRAGSHSSVAIYRLALALSVPPAWLLPDIDRPVQRRSPEQASNKAVSVVEAELERLLSEQEAER